MKNLLLALLQLICVAALSACQFGGYVPKGKHQPVAPEELDIADLPLATPTRGELDCEAGQCRVRWRVMVSGPGQLSVTVTGPRGTQGESGLVGPRLARAFVQNVDGQAISRNDPESAQGPMKMVGNVTEGPYFVLIQGLGKGFEYTVEAEYVASGAPAAAAAPKKGIPGIDGPNRGGSPSNPRAVPGMGGRDQPGDDSDGADYAYDPNANLLALKTYAFADNPQAQLDGAQPEEHGNPFIIRQIQREIRYALSDDDILQVEPGDADFLISVQVGSSSTTWYSLGNDAIVTPYDTYFSAWRTAGAFVSPHTYVDGTLVIDFIDPTTKKLIWHGWTTKPVNVNLDDQKLLRSAVDTVLDQFTGGG